MPIDGETFKRLGSSTAGAVSIVAAYDRTGKDIAAIQQWLPTFAHET